MFYRDGKKRTSTQAKPTKDLTRIVSIDALLNEGKRGPLLQKIQETFTMDSSRYEELCASLIKNAADYYQNLPETLNAYYSQPGGLMDHALHRTEAALSLFTQFLILEEGGGLSDEQKLWQYVLFSSALLQGIGKIYVDFVVDIYDNKGQYVKPWNPLFEALNLAGGYYSCRFQKEADLEFRHRVNLLLARSLMPAEGFSWIISNPEALATWLALINEDFYSAGTLGAVLIRADALALQEYFNELLIKINAARSKYSGIGTFSGGAHDLGDIEQRIGAEFLQWLHSSLTDGKLVINKSVMMVSDGLLLSDETLKAFMQANPEYKNLEAVRKGILSLGLHQVGLDGSVISRYQQNNNKEMHAGMVFPLAVALPEEAHFKHLVSGQAPMTAISLIYQSQFDTLFTRQQRAATDTAMKSLNKAGQWQKVMEVLSPAPGSFLSGMHKSG